MKKAIAVITLVIVVSFQGLAQGNDRVGRTWKGPDISAIWRADAETKSTPSRVTAIKFTPAGDSGVIAALVDALGSDAQQRAVLLEAFAKIKQGYEAEVAREGKSNNLAAALTFFIAANVVAYHQTEMPSDAETEKLFQSLQPLLAKVPAFASLSNSEKHQMHDWLVYMGGFALINYMDAKQSGDAQMLATIKEFADYSMRLVLGIEAGKVSVSGGGLAVQAPAASSVNGKVVGTWTAAASAQYGGVMRLRYIFNADGTYSFKAERSSTSQKWWTTEESGSYSVAGDSLTVTPRVSKATLRNLNGVVQETRSNALERVTYKWTTHFFEGIGETNLVMEPPQATNRDGILGSNSLFPRAYLYTQGDRLAWRF